MLFYIVYLFLYVRWPSTLLYHMSRCIINCSLLFRLYRVSHNQVYMILREKTSRDERIKLHQVLKWKPWNKIFFVQGFECISFKITLVLDMTFELDFPRYTLQIQFPRKRKDFNEKLLSSRLVCPRESTSHSLRNTLYIVEEG